MAQSLSLFGSAHIYNMEFVCVCMCTVYGYLNIVLAHECISVHLSCVQGVYVIVWMHCQRPGMSGSLWWDQEIGILFQAGWGYKRAESTLSWRQKQEKKNSV